MHVHVVQSFMLLTNRSQFCIIVQIKKNLATLILDRKVWESVKIVICSLFPALILLRLADSNRPNMDKLHFYMRHMDRCLQTSKELLNQLEDELKKKSLGTVDDVVNDDTGLDDLEKADGTDDDDSISMETAGIGSETDEASNHLSLGDRFIACWNHRRSKLVHSYSIAGWMLSLTSDILNDAKANQTFDDKRKVEDLLIKIMKHEAEMLGDDVSKMLDTFWTEHNNFHAKKNVHGGTREYIWNSQDIK